MEELKTKIFDVLAGFVSMIEFETWLYSNVDIIDKIEGVGLEYDLVSFDYQSKHAFVHFRKRVLNAYNKDEFLVYILEKYFKQLVCLDEFSNLSKVTDIVKSIGFYRDWSSSIELFRTFRYVQDDIDLVKGDYFMRSTIAYAQYVLSEFEGCTLKLKIDFMNSDIHQYYNFYKVGEKRN